MISLNLLGHSTLQLGLSNPNRFQLPSALHVDASYNSYCMTASPSLARIINLSTRR